MRSCFKYGSPNHFLRDCLEKSDRERAQSTWSGSITFKGKLPRNSGMTGNNRSGTKESSIWFEARALARAYAIRACEEVTRLDKITGTFSLFTVIVYALIDPGSNHSYICTTLVLNKNISVGSTEFIIKGSNPLGQHVLVNNVCRNCLLKIEGCDFSTDLMLFPFDEFDMILDMDWLILHDTVVSCKQIQIELKCQIDESIRIESDRYDSTVSIISTLSAQRCI